MKNDDDPNRDIIARQVGRSTIAGSHAFDPRHLNSRMVEKGDPSGRKKPKAPKVHIPEHQRLEAERNAMAAERIVAAQSGKGPTKRR